MNLLMSHYYVFSFVEKLLEKRAKNKITLQTRELKKQNKAA